MLNKDCRLIIVAFILSAMQDAECRFSFSTEVQDRMMMVGSRKRQKLGAYFNDSRFFEIAVNYSTGHHSRIWTLKGIRMVRRYAYQHNMVVPDEGGLGSILPSSSLASPSSPASLVLRHPDTRWMCSGATEQVLLPLDWYRRYGQSYRDACTSLHGEQWKFVACVKWSLQQTIHDTPSHEACLKLANERKNLPWKKLSANPLSDEEWAKLVRDRWIECWDDPLFYLSRVERRLYYPLVSQSKRLRHGYLKFVFKGKCEPMAEVDMTSTFRVLLATMLHDSPCKSRLVKHLHDGIFYHLLNEAAGKPYADRSELKVAVQRECLFGRRDFGKTPLFKALLELYPDLARLILHRGNHHKVKWMSDLLTNAEGSFFIDKLLPCIVNAGIPALPIHDCLCVPVSVAKQVAERCCKLAKEQFGFEPHFKVTPSDVSA